MNRVKGNTVSVMVFWPTKDESLSATAFLLICLSFIDNVMLVLYYLILGLRPICNFTRTCQHYVKVSGMKYAMACKFKAKS